MSGAGSSTRGGSQCGLSLRLTQRADEVRGHNYKDLGLTKCVDGLQLELISPTPTLKLILYTVWRLCYDHSLPANVCTMSNKIIC